jgi:signal transduction histidine kinase
MLGLGEVARDVLDSLEDLAADKHQQLELLGDDQVAARANRQLLRQALLNIVHNAIRYSPHETRIQVRMCRAEGEAMIEVVDEGPGIDAAHRAKIFDRFYRADFGRTREDGGYGLGLAIARTSIERQGGCIEVDGKTTHGSIFRIRLPLQTAELPGRPPNFPHLWPLETPPPLR